MNKKYPPREYAKLTPDQKQKLFRIYRKSRAATTKTSARIFALESQLKAQAKPNSDEDDLFASDVKDSNLNNAAPACQKKKPKKGGGENNEQVAIEIENEIELSRQGDNDVVYCW